MGLTITATFEKQGIYFAGDTLECHIRFANVRSAQKDSDNSRTSTADRAGASQNGVMPMSRKFTNRSDYPVAAAPLAESANEAAAFPSLDGCGLEYSAAPPPLQASGGRRQSIVPITRGSSLSRPPPMPKPPGRDSPAFGTRQASRASERDAREGIAAAQRRGSGLAVFPSLEGGSPNSADLSPRADLSRAFRVHSISRDDGRRTINEDYSPVPSRRQPSASNWRDIGAMSPDASGPKARLSTSSALSTPTTAFTSWLPFGIKQTPNPPRKPTPSVLNENASSEAGSSGLLSNLWRNISGGSNPPSRPATRTGTMAEDDFGIERLAIGFAEVSGSIGLSAS
ncbi:hypothetical protein GGI21_005140, partial [Coemansia aciculifera]